MADEHPEKTDDDQNESCLQTEVTKSGWLIKRSKVAHKWEKKFFDLSNNKLHYADSSPLDKVCVCDQPSWNCFLCKCIILF